MNEITVSMEEYKNLVKAQARIEVFAQYVNEQDYSINREKCAQFLGFELENKNEE